MTKNLREFSYYKTGGQCHKLHLPTNTLELQKAVLEIKESGKPFFILGGGSNSLVLDDYYEGHVIVTKYLNNIDVDESNSLIRAGAGVDNSDISTKALEKNLFGISWIHRLPGSIGGTVRMNARCYGGEISQVAERITTVSLDGEVKQYTNTQGVFRGYKDTIFMDNGDIISEVIIKLTPSTQDQIEPLMIHCEADRKLKNQFSHPSCGCVFKNNYQVGVPSGMLLDNAGVHSFSSEKVQINPKHANFVFNLGASSEEILTTTTKMREAVYNKFGVWLEYEMEILGNMSKEWTKRINEEREQKFNQATLAPLKEQFKKK